MKLLRWAAYVTATLLAGFSTSAGLGLTAWKALIVGASAGLVPVCQAALYQFARTGQVPEPPDGTP